ncbi:MAG: hypothetical protein P8182_18195, partial [Deltaproteobacteria bacterium]
MADRYQQFLGTNPGIFVELIDDSSSPYLVKTEEGFEFSISAEDFKNYYRKEGDATPQRWSHLITDRERGTVDSGTMIRVLEVVNSFSESLGDFEKARSFLRDALAVLDDASQSRSEDLRGRLRELGWDTDTLSEQNLSRVHEIPEEIRELLLSDACAVIPFVDVPSEAASAKTGVEASPDRAGGDGARQRPVKADVRKETAVKRSSARMKNVELSVEKEILTVTVDLSKE